MNISTPSLTVCSPSFQGNIGVASADITPPVGIFARNWGAANHDFAEGIHRPLTLTALTLQTERNAAPLVLLAADLGWWRNAGVEREFRASILERLRLKPEQFIFALAHTHAGPVLSDERDDSRKYLDQLRETTARVVTSALESATTATLGWSHGKCALATHRDLPARDGRMLVGFNPDVSADDTLLVGRVTNSAGDVTAVLVNYACHPTTLGWENKLISPDYVGALRETIAAQTGGAAVLFLQGASGELAPRYQYVGDHAVADAHGRQLAWSVLAALNGMQPAGQELAYAGVTESGTALAVWKRQPATSSTVLRALHPTVELQLKDWPSADELERQREACSERALEERLRRQRDIRRSLGDGRSYALPLWVWQIGDVWFVGTMCEAYSWLQTELRRRFPDRTIVCLNLINGSIGYLAPAEAYDDNRYAVWQSPFDRGSLERLADAMEKSLRLSS